MKTKITKNKKDYQLIFYGENNIIYFDLLISQSIINELANECDEYRELESIKEIKL